MRKLGAWAGGSAPTCLCPRAYTYERGVGGGETIKARDLAGVLAAAVTTAATLGGFKCEEGRGRDSRLEDLTPALSLRLSSRGSGG